MAHHVYQSASLILGGGDIGEANRYLDIFTRELGLIRATALSLRVERSKLRYSLQLYTFGSVSLVRGKSMWRITGALGEINVYSKLKNYKDKLTVFNNVTSLLRRLLQGEEQNIYLFDVIKSFIEYISESDLDKDEIKAVEYITVLRILYSLGYVRKKEGIFDSHEYNEKYFDYVLSNEKNILSEINTALKESHL